MMRLSGISIAGIGPLHHLRLDGLAPMTAVVGAHGTGKSLLVSCLAWLQAAVRTGTTQPGHALRAPGDDRRRVGASDQGGRIGLTFVEEAGQRLRYEVEIGWERGAVVVHAESLAVDAGEVLRRRGQTAEFGVADDSRSSCVRADELALAAPDLAAASTTAARVRDAILEWVFVTPAPRTSRDGGLDAHGPLARAVASAPAGVAEAIASRLKAWVPGMAGLRVVRLPDGRAELKLLDRSLGVLLGAGELSDGTQVLLHLITLLLTVEPGRLLCFEHPEAGLYPFLLAEFAEEMRGYTARGGQVLVTTHSYDFVNGVELEELFWLERRGRASVARRASDDHQLAALVAAGDPLGALWRQGLLGKVHP